MKRLIIWLLLTIIALCWITFAGWITQSSNNSLAIWEENKGDYDVLRIELKKAMREDIEFAKNDLRKIFDDYLVIIKEIKSDFRQYFKIVIWIIASLGAVLWFYIQKITHNLVNNRVNENIKPILDNKITQYDQKIEEDLQRVWAEIREKSILIIPLDPRRLSVRIIENQWFNSVLVLDQISDGLTLDVIVLDILDFNFTDQNNIRVLSDLLTEVNSHYTNIPLLIFHKWSFPRGDMNLPELITFANNQLTLISNLYDCLRYQKDIWNASVWI